MSRLLTGNISYKGGELPIGEYRNAIFARSLYNLNNEYENTNMFSLNNKSEVASSISTILNVIPQWNRLQVNTNLAGNVYDAFREDGSPLAKIGLEMLGKQMLLNSAMNLSVAYLPSMDISQALKGNMKGVFKLNRDNTITVKNKEDKSFLDKVGSVASSVLGFDTYDVFGDANPFDKNPTNIDYIRNTGKAQLTRFYDAVNMNIYKPVNYVSNSAYGRTFTDYADEVGVKVDYPRNITVATRQFFTFNNAIYNPYWRYNINNDAIEIANQAQVKSFTADTGVQEYAPYQAYVDKNFGVVKIERDKTRFNYVDEESNISKDGISDKLIWGRDGLIPQSADKIKLDRGDADSMIFDEPNDPLSDQYGFKIKEGLLEYTKNLLNATEGQFIDITKKTFKKDDNIVGFQGSPLWRGPRKEDSKYADESGNARKSGVRQHTILDPYGIDKTNLIGTQGFAKTIRFKGNVVYNGSDYSVVNKTVLPRIHPTMKDGKMNNKNLMFSLENLAVGTIKRDTYGVIDDEFGTAIPLSEVGPFAGRQMWFPPYNIELNEVAAARFESTVMVGRNEPMYNYMNSERSAVLTFSLLVDYPEQLRDAALVGGDVNKAIADFFAFGGNPPPEEYVIEQLEKEIEDLENSIPKKDGPTDQAEPAPIEVDEVAIYFQNDTPSKGEENTIIQTMYDNPNHYEIIDGMESAQDGNGWGKNHKIYYRTGLTKTTSGYTLDYSTNQYSATGATDQFGPCLLNKNLLEVYRNTENRKYYNIRIEGTASKLYLNENEKAYNEALGNRRIEAAIHLIKSKLKIMFPDVDVNDFKFDVVAGVGSSGGSAAGAEAKNMHKKEVKEERAAIINIRRNGINIEPKEQQLNQKQIEDNAKIQQDIQTKTLQLKRLKAQTNENFYNERTKAILNGFEASSNNEFYPVFHSQTPEDFHRRLTFLQQCTRQGSAQRYDIVDEDGKLRARNSVFGKQPICVLRVGDFWYTKVVIESVTIDYADAPWDMNPEGLGMQPMMANVTLQMKVIGGQSLKGPIDALQNANTYNYYANSTFKNTGVYARASKVAGDQFEYINGVVTKKQGEMTDKYKLTEAYKVREGEV